MINIEIRGKRTANGEWSIGYPFKSTSGKYYIITEANEIAFSSVEINPDTLSRYVGKEDKNGEIICEHDIVRTTYKEIREFHGVKYESEIQLIETVVFNEATAAFELQIDIDGVKLYRRLIIGDTVNNVTLVSLEVIGNIFDNPELLKGE